MMHAMAGTLHLGTSGFSFDGWKHGVFYPEGLKNREMLTYYSQQLSSVEINYTFRRFPSEKSLTAWREQAADGFTFTLKANQRITHFKRLADTDGDVRAFLELAKLLGDKLGCVLFQCPPSLHYDRALIEAFVGLPPAGWPVRDGVPPLLVGRGEGPVAVPGRRLVRRRDRQRRTRSRRPLMGADRLPAAAEDRVLRRGARAWADRIAPALASGADVFCYFKHEEDGAGPKMAKRLRATLDDRAAGAASA